MVDSTGTARVYARGTNRAPYFVCCAGANGIWEEDEPPGQSWAAGLASLGFTTF